MAATARKHWLICYDIRNPKRLLRIHRYLRQRGVAVQYSAFGLELDDRQLRQVLDDLEMLMDPRVDDIRAYHIPAHCRIWKWGRQTLPEGLAVHASVAMRLLGSDGDPEDPAPASLLPRQLFLV